MMNRGDQREAIFKDDEAQQEFLATLGEACDKIKWAAADPFLPLRAICNLENLPGGPQLPLARKDASRGRRARIRGGLTYNSQWPAKQKFFALSDGCWAFL